MDNHRVNVPGDLEDGASRDPRAWIRLAQAAARGGDHDLALARWRDCRERFPAVLEGWVGCADTLLKMRRFEDAERAYRDMIAWHPGRPQGYEGLARAAAMAGDHALALQRWHACCARFPASLAGWTGCVDALLKAQRPVDAERVSRGMVVWHPNRPQSYEGLARAAAQRGEQGAALERWRDCCVRFPEAQPGWAAWLDGLLKARRLEEAERAGRGMIVWHPERPQGYEGLARAAAQRGNDAAALVLFACLADRFPGFLAGHVGRLRALKALGRQAECVAQAERTVRAFPFHPYGWEILIKDAITRRSPGRAERLLAAMQGANLSAEDRFRLENQFDLLRGRFSVVESRIRERLRTDPGCLEAYRTIIAACLGSGRHRELFHWANRLRRSGLDNAAALNALVESLLQLGHYRLCHRLIMSKAAWRSVDPCSRWLSLFKYYTSLNVSSPRNHAPQRLRHRRRLGRIILRRWPWCFDVLDQMIPLAEDSRELQDVLIAHAKAHHPKPEEFSFRARSAWLLHEIEDTVSDRKEDWLSLRATIDPRAAVCHWYGYPFLDMCRVYAACRDPKGLRDFIFELRRFATLFGPTVKLASGANQAFLAATLWHRDEELARQAFQLVARDLRGLARDRSRNTRIDAALETLDLFVSVYEIQFFESRKPAVDSAAAKARACLSTSHFLSVAYEARFQPLAFDPTAFIERRDVDRILRLLRYLVVAAAADVALRSQSGLLVQCMRYLSALIAYSDIEVKRLARFLEPMRRVAAQGVRQGGSAQAAACLDVHYRIDLLAAYLQGGAPTDDSSRQAIIRSLNSLACSRGVRDRWAESDIHLDALWGAIRCHLGDRTPLLQAKERVANRKGRIEQGVLSGLYDFGDAQRILGPWSGEGEAAAALPPVPRTAVEVWSFSSRDQRPVMDCAIVVSCDSRYLMKYGWVFLSTLNAGVAPDGPKAHVHFHVVNPQAHAFGFVLCWSRILGNIHLTLSQEDKDRPNPAYYAMARYRVASAVQRLFTKPILILDIDFWFLRGGLADLMARLQGCDLAAYEFPDEGVRYLLPWSCVWSGVVYIGRSENALKIIDDMSDMAERISRDETFRWYIDQNFFYERLPVWKAVCGEGNYVNLRSLGVFGGKHIATDGVRCATGHLRYFPVNTTAMTRLSDGHR